MIALTLKSNVDLKSDNSQLLEENRRLRQQHQIIVQEYDWHAGPCASDARVDGKKALCSSGKAPTKAERNYFLKMLSSASCLQRLSFTCKLPLPLKRQLSAVYIHRDQPVWHHHWSHWRGLHPVLHTWHLSMKDSFQIIHYHCDLDAFGFN